MFLDTFIWYLKHFKGNLKLIFPKTGWNELKLFFLVPFKWILVNFDVSKIFAKVPCPYAKIQRDTR